MKQVRLFLILSFLLISSFLVACSPAAIKPPEIKSGINTQATADKKEGLVVDGFSPFQHDTLYSKLGKGNKFTNSFSVFKPFVIYIDGNGPVTATLRRTTSNKIIAPITSGEIRREQGTFIVSISSSNPNTKWRVSVTQDLKGAHYPAILPKVDPATIGIRKYARSSSSTASGNLYNCSDFSSSEAAQRFFLSHGGPASDIHDLDRDGDGLACEWGTDKSQQITSTYRAPSTSSSSGLCGYGKTWVNGYYRKSGTYVRGYCRSK